MSVCQTATFPVMVKGIDTQAFRQRNGQKMVLVQDPETLLKYYDRIETPDDPNVMLQE